MPLKSGVCGSVPQEANLKWRFACRSSQHHEGSRPEQGWGGQLGCDSLAKRPQSDPWGTGAGVAPQSCPKWRRGASLCTPSLDGGYLGRGSSLELKAIPRGGLSNKLSAAITHGCWGGKRTSEGGLGSRPRLLDASQPFQEDFCLEQKISPRISE